MHDTRDSTTPLAFAKSSRLLKPAEFRNVYQNGVRQSGRLFAAFCVKLERGDGSGPRLGFTLPRAFGRAVARNRAKRRVREALRLRLAEVGREWDIVINPRRTLLSAAQDELRAEVDRLVNRCKAR